MHDKLLAVVREEKIWVDQQHRFLLTPDAFHINRQQVCELTRMGNAIHECLQGIGRIATVAGDGALARQPGLRSINKALWTGIPASFGQFLPQNPSAIPQTLKVDLMVTPQGRFVIGEIDAYNERSLGYCELTARLREVSHPDAPTFPGVAQKIASAIRKRSKNDSALLIYADKERFYLPEFQILARAVSKYGAVLQVCSETELTIQGTELFLGNELLEPNLVFYLPFLYRNKRLDSWLRDRAKEGNIKFLIPPKPYLGNKTVLALLRNDENDPQIEAVLRTFVSSDALTTIREFIPKTFLLRKGLDQAPKGRFVLKKAVSSGAREIYFPEDAGYEVALSKALTTDSVFILQEEVETKEVKVSHFTESGELTSSLRRLRVNAYFVERVLADMAVTANPEKLVHGGTNSIFMGVALTD